MKANYETKEQSKVNGSFNMSLYDMNKQIIAQLPALTEEAIQEKYNLIDEFGKGKQWCMLLGREFGYYTLFHHLHKDADETFASAVLDCLSNLGPIQSIEYTDDDHNAVEIWVMRDGEATVLYLFNYAEGVIECQM